MLSEDRDGTDNLNVIEISDLPAVVMRLVCTKTPGRYWHMPTILFVTS